MLRYSSPEALLADLGHLPAWRAVVRAVQQAAWVRPDVTYSTGDAVTYRVLTHPDRPEPTGHRRYREVRAVVRGHLVVEVAPGGALEASGPYDDLTDRQPFSGSGDVHVLGTGEVLVLDLDDVLRDVEVDGVVVLARVSVEVPGPAGDRSATAG